METISCSLCNLKGVFGCFNRIVLGSHEDETTHMKNLLWTPPTTTYETKIVRRRSEEKKRGDVTLENNTSYRYKILVVNIWPDPKMMNNWYLFFINRIFTNKKMFLPFPFLCTQNFFQNTLHAKYNLCLYQSNVKIVNI